MVFTGSRGRRNKTKQNRIIWGNKKPFPTELYLFMYLVLSYFDFFVCAISYTLIQLLWIVFTVLSDDHQKLSLCAKRRLNLPALIFPVHVCLFIPQKNKQSYWIILKRSVFQLSCLFFTSSVRTNLLQYDEGVDVESTDFEAHPTGPPKPLLSTCAKPNTSSQTRPEKYKTLSAIQP